MLWWVAETSLVGAALALIAGLVSRVRPLGPAARHALWLVVLIKLVTPPVVQSPWAWPVSTAQASAVASLPDSVRGEATVVWLASECTAAADLAATDCADAECGLNPAEPTADGGLREAGLTLEGLPLVRFGGTDGSEARFVALGPDSGRESDRPALFLATPAPDRVEATADRSAWLFGLLVVWGMVTAVLTTIQAVRVVRFSRRLRDALPAPEWIVDELDELASRLNVRPPEALALPGLGVPLLWCLGRPKLLLPAHLLKTLPAERWRGVLAHELAHLKRGDPWVARLALAAGLVWWWNPVFRLARRRLDAEAELACDAWVVWALPADRVVYAGTMLDICESLSRTELPPLAPALGVSGAGRIFERRLTMILSDRVPCRLSLPGLIGPGLLALLGLPSWTATAAPTPAAAAAALAIRGDDARVIAVAAAPADDDDDDQDEADKAKRAEVEAKVKEVRARILEQHARLQAGADQIAAVKEKQEVARKHLQMQMEHIRAQMAHAEKSGSTEAKASLEKALSGLEKAMAALGKPGTHRVEVRVEAKGDGASAGTGKATAHTESRVFLFKQGEDGKAVIVTPDGKPAEGQVRVFVHKKGEDGKDMIIGGDGKPADGHLQVFVRKQGEDGKPVVVGPNGKPADGHLQVFVRKQGEDGKAVVPGELRGHVFVAKPGEKGEEIVIESKDGQAVVVGPDGKTLESKRIRLFVDKTGERHGEIVIDGKDGQHVIRHEVRIQRDAKKDGDKNKDKDKDKGKGDEEKDIEIEIRDLSKAFGPDSEFIKGLEKLGPELEKRLREKFGPGSEFEGKMKDLGEKLGQELKEKLGPGSDFDKAMKEMAKSLEKQFGPGSDFEKHVKEFSGEVEKRMKEAPEAAKEPKGEARPGRDREQNAPARLRERARSRPREDRVRELEARIKALSKELEKAKAEDKDKDDDDKDDDDKKPEAK